MIKHMYEKVKEVWVFKLFPSRALMQSEMHMHMQKSWNFLRYFLPNSESLQNMKMCTKYIFKYFAPFTVISASSVFPMVERVSSLTDVNGYAIDIITDRLDVV